LSQLQVATFPWDPKPESTPQIANPPTVPSNAGNYQPMNTPPIQQAQGGLTMPQVSSNGAPRVKTEPGLENSNNGPPSNYQQPPMITPAQQRAAQHLAQNYGSRAAASINAIQGGRGQPVQNGQMPTMEQMQQARMQQAQAQQAAAQGLTMPQGQGMQQNRMTQEQYRSMMAANVQRQMQQQQQAANGQNGVGNAQTDGAGDEVESLSVIKRFGADGQEISMGRIEIDGLIRQKIEAMGTTMEGGGLMLPLHKASTASKRSRKVKRTTDQTDGGDDDDDDKDGVKDELDEDAINSDLDDPDEGLNEEEDEDEGMGHIMLCMYDKVQRVKNKWLVPLLPL
jgi:transcription initiation factor TFIIA large subunit